jgi:hypothetical protein
MELRPIDPRDAGEIERAITAFARGSNGGLLVTGSSSATLHLRSRLNIDYLPSTLLAISSPPAA